MSLTSAMKHLLRTMTPDQVTTLIETAKQPRATVDLPRNVSSGKGKKKPGRADPVTKATRPLNSWIAFRSYYSKAFPNFQQKEISGFLNYMWQSDPFKAKWSILAKSYSLIRDSQGREKAPLDQFLAINGAFIGIVEPQEYLRAMGWEIAIDEEGQTVMRRKDLSIDDRFRTTNLSVNDVIRHSYRQGYFAGNLSEVLSSDNEAVMTMASLIQPALTVHFAIPRQNADHEAEVAGLSDADSFSKDGGNLETEDLAAKAAGQIKLASNGIKAANEVTQMSDACNVCSAPETVQEKVVTATPGPSHFTLTVNTSSTFDQDTLDRGAPAMSNGGMEEIQAPQTTYADLNPASGLSAANFHVDSEYPFNAEFDPRSPGFTFDPFLGNRFDVFEMSDPSWDTFIDFDAYA